MKLLLLSLLAVFSMPIVAAPVNINSANAQTIADSLNGVGIKKAEAIVAYREKNGAFKTIEDLNKVSGIGEKTIEKNKADILFADTSSVPVSSAATKPELKPAAAAQPAKKL